MRGACAVVGAAMATIAWHSFKHREWLYFSMATPWAIILFLAAIFGEEV